MWGIHYLDVDPSAKLAISTMCVQTWMTMTERIYVISMFSLLPTCGWHSPVLTLGSRPHILLMKHWRRNQGIRLCPSQVKSTHGKVNKYQLVQWTILGQLLELLSQVLPSCPQQHQFHLQSTVPQQQWVVQYTLRAWTPESHLPHPHAPWPPPAPDRRINQPVKFKKQWYQWTNPVIVYNRSTSASNSIHSKKKHSKMPSIVSAFYSPNVAMPQFVWDRID